MAKRTQQSNRSAPYGIALLLLALLATEAVACPACTYDRLLATNWHAKWMAINIFVPMIFVANRLDLVRLLYVLIPYACFIFELHSFLLWHAFGWRTWPLGLIITIAELTLALNLVGAGLLYGISHLTFFRRNPEKGLSCWQPVAYSATAFLLTMLIRR